MAINFSGLATGLDTAALVEQLVSVEKQGARLLEQRKSDAGRRKSIVADLVLKLQSLKSAAASVNTSSEIRALTATSSDDKKVKVTGSGSAQPAQLALHVNTLARAQTSVSSLFPSSDGAVPLVPGAGQLGIKVGAADEVVIDFTSLDTLDSVAQQINERVSGAQAQVINTGAGFQLVVGSRETGLASAITFSEGGTSLGFLAPDSLKVAAQDASFTLNGIGITRPTNVIGDAIAGLTLELVATHGAGEADTQVSVVSNPTGTQDKVKGLVDAFNALTDLVNAQTTYSGVTRGQDSLFGDSTVRALQRSLSTMATNSYAHGEESISLGQLGISLGRDGKLTIDSARLADAVGKDPQAIEDVIAGEGGLAVAIDDLVAQYTRTGDGFLSAKTSSLTREMSDYEIAIERIEARADKIGDQLRAQFNTLETLMSNLQSQQAALSSLLG